MKKKIGVRSVELCIVFFDGSFLMLYMFIVCVFCVYCF